MSNVKKAIHDLEKNIINHEYNYRVLDNPTITDQDFDSMYSDLKKLSEKYPQFVSKNSPLNKIGSVLVDGFKKIKHNSIMGSIDNTYNSEGVREWVDKLSIVLYESPNNVKELEFDLENKYDGISGSLIYENGLLIRAATRGDGKIGDDITNNAKMCWNIPHEINIHDNIEVRGEFVIFKTDFEKVNQIENANFKNPRNLVSGTMKSLNSQVVRNRFVHFIPFQVFDKNGKQTSLDYVYSYFETEGFKLPEIISGNIEHIINCIQLREKEKLHKEEKYLVDGAVIKVASFADREKLGYASNDCPKWALAYKFKQEVAHTPILNVIWQVGRNKITPVAEIEPVELEGTTVSRASLHNLSQFELLNLCYGDIIEIEKAGFIIPHINKVVESSGDVFFKVPQICPSCGEPTSIVEIESKELRCTNPDCFERVVRNVMYFVKALSIDSIGESFIREVVSKKIVKKPLDILKLNKDELLTLDRMGKVKANKIHKNIQKAIVQPCNKVIECLGISEVGESNAEKIGGIFTFDEFVCIGYSDLSSIENIGNTTTQNILDYIEENKEYLCEIKETFVIRKEEGFSEKLKGKKFVVTGAATKSRDEIQSIIKKNGGEISSGVSKKTDYLIIGSKEDDGFNSSKKKKAVLLNVEIHNEFWLFEQVGFVFSYKIKADYDTLTKESKDQLLKDAGDEVNVEDFF